MTRFAWILVLVGVFLLGGCARGQDQDAAPESVTLAVFIECSNGLYCTNIDDTVCRFSTEFKRFPSNSVTVSGSDKVVLASKSLPIDGKVRGGPASSAPYLCMADVEFRVPKRDLYVVDAFGMASETGQGPFTLRLP